MAYLTNTVKNVEGTSISIDDSYKLKDLVLEGDTYQEGTPTPDEPKEIQVATGRQELVVIVRNLINYEDKEETTYNGAYYFQSLNTNFKLEVGKTYTFSADVTSTVEPFQISVGAGSTSYTRDILTIPNLTSGRVSITFTPTESNLSTGNNFFFRSPRYGTTQTFTFSVKNIQLEYGDIVHDFEPYTEKNYEINLGKNLVKSARVDSGTSIYNVTLFVEADLEPSTTYTISFYGTNGNQIYANENLFTTGKYINITNDRVVITLTTKDTISKDDVRQYNSSYQKWVIFKNGKAEDSANVYNDLQIEKGSQATSYSEYFEPIWLGGINDYKDEIFKSSGKNLLNESLFTTTGSANVSSLNNGEVVSNSITGYSGVRLELGQEISFKANEEIYISCKIKGNNAGNVFNTFQLMEKNSTTALSGATETRISTPNVSTSFQEYKLKLVFPRDITFGRLFIQHKGSSSDIFTIRNIMISNYNIDYEPYGTDWYLKKEIGKEIWNGTETWAFNSTFTDVSQFYHPLNATPTSTGDGYCNYFIVENSFTNYQHIKLHNSNTRAYLYIDNNIATDLTMLRTWFGTHNTEVYYALATPTYTKITNQELISQLNAVRLLEGVNNITVDSPYLSSILSLDYYSQENPYQDAIYSQDDSNDLKIYFNDVELEDAGRYCEKITRIARILPNDGGKRFSLDNFISTSVEVILHNVDIEDIVDQVRIEIGTDIGNNTFEYVPLGVFNIQDTPEKDGNKITLKLRDNRVKFDFNYNAYPLIQSLGGSATKKQILDDICEQAGVECLIDSFNGDSDLIGIYDSTISATTYVSYLMEQAGLIPVIDRYGRLIAIDLSQLDKWRIPLSIVESYEKGSPYGIERVVYESGTLKYETSDNDTLDTLYLNSANPYVSSNSQVSYILDKLQDFNIDSVTTKRVLGNPAIDPYDIIEVYNDLDGSNDIVFRTLGNTTYTFNGVHRDVFDTQIGKEERTENVTIRGLPAFQKYAKVEIDNMNATITQTVTSVEELQESIDLFSVDLSQYNVVIATDSDRKPYTTETIAVNYYGYYKGQQVTPTVAITGSESNVTVTTSNTAINFKVTQGNAVGNKSYTYTATFTYNDAGTTYTVAKKIVLSLSIEGKAGQDGQDGQDGRDGTDGTSAYFYVRYSANADGSNMTVAPQSDTKYMGVASTTSSTPPTQPSGYVWSEIRGEDGQDGQQGIPGQPGADGTSSYLHIKWSDDGISFTPAEGSTPAGKTPGRWQGTYVDTNQTDSTTFSDYNWVDTGIYVQDELNSLETSIGAVDARVTDTNTNIANNYYNKDQVDALSEANANNIATVTQRVVTLEQKSDSYAININKILTNGVSSVTTATGYVFNENGLNISKTGSEIANLLDNTGMFVRRNNTEMLGADSTGVRAENLLVRKYLIMGTNSRFEDYESNRTACFYIGGSN